jgi:hypothetical protein
MMPRSWANQHIAAISAIVYTNTVIRSPSASGRANTYQLAMRTSVSSSFRRLCLAQMTFSMTLSPNVTKTERDVNRGGGGENACSVGVRAMLRAFAISSGQDWQQLVMCTESAELCCAVLTLRKSWQSLELHERKGQSPEGQLISQSSHLRPYGCEALCREETDRKACMES